MLCRHVSSRCSCMFLWTCICRFLILGLGVHKVTMCVECTMKFALWSVQIKTIFRYGDSATTLWVWFLRSATRAFFQPVSRIATISSSLWTATTRRPFTGPWKKTRDGYVFLQSSHHASWPCLHVWNLFVEMCSFDICTSSFQQCLEIVPVSNQQWQQFKIYTWTWPAVRPFFDRHVPCAACAWLRGLGGCLVQFCGSCAVCCLQWCFSNGNTHEQKIIEVSVEMCTCDWKLFRLWFKFGHASKYSALPLWQKSIGFRIWSRY